MKACYKVLSGERAPGFDTILKVIGALGLKLHAEVVQVRTEIAELVAGGHGEDQAAPKFRVMCNETKRIK